MRGENLPPAFSEVNRDAGNGGSEKFDGIPKRSLAISGENLPPAFSEVNHNAFLSGLGNEGVKYSGEK